MAKTTDHRKITQNKNEQAVEHTKVYDDSFLPDSEELQKLKSVDESLIPFIKERTQREQESRLSFNDRRMSLFEKIQKDHTKIDLTRIYLAFFLLALTIVLSSYLLLNDCKLEGSILGGSAIVIAAISFLKAPVNKSTLEESQKKNNK